MKDALLMFWPGIMLKPLRFKSSVLFEMHALLDKSIKVFQLPKHLSNLTENAYYWNSWLYSLWCKLIKVDDYLTIDIFYG